MSINFCLRIVFRSFAPVPMKFVLLALCHLSALIFFFFFFVAWFTLLLVFGFVTSWLLSYVGFYHKSKFVGRTYATSYLYTFIICFVADVQNDEFSNTLSIQVKEDDKSI